MEVECDMNVSPHAVATLVHNNLESWITVSGYESPMSYQRNITYFATRWQIEAIKASSTHCEQMLEFQCSYSVAFTKSYWTSFHGELVSYQYDDDRDCLCKLQKACEDGHDVYVQHKFFFKIPA